jgi:16S rRNA (adenine1518-N6/adenine1519-N6)-dimethyltransferase
LPRKFGQHFLADQSILRRLASAACGEHCQRVVEIGSGRGALTQALLPRTDELHAIEIDPILVARLRSQLSTEAKLFVHHCDVLETDLTRWGPAVITGNLPYYITSPIIERFLRLDANFPAAVFLMQSEVAARVMAPPRTRDYGFLSVFCQLLCDVELVCKVPPGAFRPPPKVDSAAVRFARRSAVPQNWNSVLELASRSFAQKRKTLRNNLKPFYRGAIEREPEASLRAEQLSVRHFIDLHNRLVS